MEIIELLIVDFFTNDLYGFYNIIIVLLIIIVILTIIAFKFLKFLYQINKEMNFNENDELNETFNEQFEDVEPPSESAVDKKVVEVLRGYSEIDSLKGQKTFNGYDAYDLVKSINDFIYNSDKLGNQLKNIINDPIPIDLNVSTHYCNCEITDLKSGDCKVSINYTNYFQMNVNDFYSINSFNDLEKYIKGNLILHSEAY